MHGGADGSGAPSGSKNGNYKHGLYTAEGPAGRAVLFRHGVNKCARRFVGSSIVRRKHYKGQQRHIRNLTALVREVLSIDNSFSLSKHFLNLRF